MIPIKRLIRRRRAQADEKTQSFGCEKAAAAKDASARALEAVVQRDKVIKALPGLLLAHAHHQEPVR